MRGRGRRDSDGGHIPSWVTLGGVGGMSGVRRNVEDKVVPREREWRH